MADQQYAEPSRLDQFSAKALANGYTKQDVDNFLQQKRQQATSAGYSDDDINKYLGAPDQQPMQDQMDHQATVANSWGEAWKAGVENWTTMAGGKRDVTMPEDAPLMQRVANGFGDFYGSIPAMMAGGAAGAAAGAPFAGVGAVPGSVIGAFALPSIIKNTYAYNLKHGRITSVGDFATREGVALMGGVQGAEQAAGYMAGGPILGKMSPFLKPVGEVLGATAVSSYISQKLPDPADLLVGALTVGMMHGVAKGAEATGNWVQARANLVDHWAATGEPVDVTVGKALTDPVLRQNLQADPRPVVPSDSSVTPHEGDEFVVGKQPPNTYTAFHGTNTDFDVYDIKMGGEATGAADAKLGVTFFTSDPDVADAYGLFAARKPAETSEGTKAQNDLENANAAEGRTGQERLMGQITKKTQLTFKNPKEVDMEGATYGATVKSQFTKIIKQAMADGHDGVIFKNVNDSVSGEPKISDVYASFKPDEAAITAHEAAAKADQERIAQVAKDAEAKSKETGQPASFADPWEQVASRQGGLATKPSWTERAKDFWNTLYTQFGRRDNPVSPIYDAAEKGAPLPPMTDPRIWNRMAEVSPVRGRAMIEGKMFNLNGDVTGPGLNEIIKPFENEKGPKNFWTYSIAKWAVEKAGQEKETGVHIDAAKQVVEEGAGKYDDAFNKLVNFQNQTLQLLRDSGIISKDDFAKYVEENKARIPGYRVGKGEKGTGAGSKVYNSIKQFMGSEDQIKNVQESILKDTLLRTALADRNMRNDNTARVAIQNGLAGRVQLTVPKNFELTEAEQANLGVDAMNGDEEFSASIWRRIGRSVRENEVPHFEDGKLVATKYENPDVYKYLNGVDVPKMSAVGKLLGRLTSIPRAAIVLNPSFPIHIMEYDLPFQFILKGRNTPVDMITGGKTVIGRLLGSDAAEARYEAALRNGALAKVHGELSADAYIRDQVIKDEDQSPWERAWNAAKTPFDMLRAWAQNLNDMQKLGRFERGLTEGEEPLQAGMKARGAAFHDPYVGGSHTNALNRTVLFLSAYVNGLDATVRGAFGLGKTITGDKLSASGFWSRGAMAITMPMVAQWWLYKDKEWYKGMNNYQRDRSIFIPIGGTADKPAMVIPIPMPPLLSFVFGTVPVRLARAAFEQDPHAFDGMETAFAQSFVPTAGAFAYSLATPIAEHLANYSFFKGRPLVSEATKSGGLAPEQYTNYSSAPAKFISKTVNDWPLVKNFKLSPPVIDNYINGYLGTLGTWAARIATIAGDSGDPDKPATKISDMPGFSSFAARYPSASAQPTQDFMDRMNTYNQIHQSLVTTLENGDMNRFKQLADQNPAAAALHSWQFRSIATAGISAENSLKAEQILQDEMMKSGKSIPDVQTILQSEKALTVSRDMVKLINMHQTPKVTELMNQIQQQFAPGSPPIKGQMTPNDKSQLIDMYYGWMQVISEHANSAMDKAGFK